MLRHQRATSTADALLPAGQRCEGNFTKVVQRIQFGSSSVPPSRARTKKFATAAGIANLRLKMNPPRQQLIQGYRVAQKTPRLDSPPALKIFRAGFTDTLWNWESPCLRKSFTPRPSGRRPLPPSGKDGKDSGSGKLRRRGSGSGAGSSPSPLDYPGWLITAAIIWKCWTQTVVGVALPRIGGPNATVEGNRRFLPATFVQCYCPADDGLARPAVLDAKPCLVFSINLFIVASFFCSARPRR